jgi:hypothetical protein
MISGMMFGRIKGGDPEPGTTHDLPGGFTAGVPCEFHPGLVREMVVTIMMKRSNAGFPIPGIAIPTFPVSFPVVACAILAVVRALSSDPILLIGTLVVQNIRFQT